MDKNELFRKYANEIGDLHEKKSKAYGDSFGQTYAKLGIISAVTRISDKYNRLCTLVTNDDIDDLGESIEDTLIDLAAYSIMTLIEHRNAKMGKEQEPVVETTQTVLCTTEIKDYQGRFLFVKGKTYMMTSENDVQNELGDVSTFSSLDELAYYFQPIDAKK